MVLDHWEKTQMKEQTSLFALLISRFSPRPNQYIAQFDEQLTSNWTSNEKQGLDILFSPLIIYNITNDFRKRIGLYLVYSQEHNKHANVYNVQTSNILDFSAFFVSQIVLILLLKCSCILGTTRIPNPNDTAIIGIER